MASALVWCGNMASALPPCFNADVSLPRLLFLVSPTCEVCVSGAISAAQAVLSLPCSEDFRLYILWLPVLEADTPRRRNGYKGVCPQATGCGTFGITT